MIPLKDYNPTKRFAFVTFLIIVVCVVVYVFVQPVGQAPIFESDPNKAQETMNSELRFDLYNAAIPCEVVTGDPLSRDEIARTFLEQPSDTNACERNDTSPPLYPDKSVYLAVVFSMFFHGSWLHLLGNMLFLWVFGNNIEDRFGVARYVVFYLASGLAATVAHVAVQPNSTVPIVGASGAIAGVMGAYLVLFPNVRIRSLLILGFFVLFRDISAKWLLGFWFLLQFFTGPNSGVAWMAHVGGFVFGLLIGLIYKAIDRPTQPQQVPWA
jgi:membrane associated rhomboid family serine protease